MICVRLLDDGDETLPSGNIDAFSSCVIVDIVRVIDARDTRNHLTGVYVDCYELGGPSRHYKDSMISFIERHWVVGFPIFQWPICDLMGIPINQHNFCFGSYIRVDNGF